MCLMALAHTYSGSWGPQAQDPDAQAAQALLVKHDASKTVAGLLSEACEAGQSNLFSKLPGSFPLGSLAEALASLSRSRTKAAKLVTQGVVRGWVCVCVCVCARVRTRVRAWWVTRNTQNQTHTHSQTHTAHALSHTRVPSIITALGNVHGSTCTHARTYPQSHIHPRAHTHTLTYPPHTHTHAGAVHHHSPRQRARQQARCDPPSGDGAVQLFVCARPARQAAAYGRRVCFAGVCL